MTQNLYPVLDTLYSIPDQSVANGNLPKFIHENVWDEYAAMGASFSGGWGQTIWSMKHVYSREERLNMISQDTTIEVTEYECKCSV